MVVEVDDLLCLGGGLRAGGYLIVKERLKEVTLAKGRAADKERHGDQDEEDEVRGAVGPPTWAQKTRPDVAATASFGLVVRGG